MKEVFNFSRSKEFNSGLLYSLFIIIYFIISTIFAVGFILIKGSIKTENLSFFCYAISSILILIVSRKNEKEEKVFLKKFNPIYLILSIILSFGMFYGFGFINLSFSNFLEKVGVNVSSISLDLSSFKQYIICTLAFCLAPAIFEEITFRHVVLNGVKGNVIIGSLLSALCFSLYHFSLSQFIYQFIYGFFLSVLAIKSGSILPSILAHFLNNFIIISTQYFNINIDLFSPFIIVIGLILTCCFVFFTLIFKGQKNGLKGEKINVLDFILGASLGMIFCIILMVGGVFG